MKNPNLYSSLKAYCEAAVEYLKSVPHSGTQDWKKFIFQQDVEVLKLPAAQQAIEQLQTDSVIASQLGVLMGTEGRERNIQAAGVLRNVLLSLVEKVGTLTFDEDVFTNVYEEMESYFYSDEFTVTYESLLEGFTSTEKEIVLEPGLIIHALNVSEATKIANALGRLGPKQTESTDGVYTFYVLRFSAKLPKVVGDQPVSQLQQPQEKKVLEIFQHVQEALRKFKPGSVGFSDMLVTREGWKLGDTPFVVRTRNTTNEGPQYLLNGDEAAQFVKLWQEK